MGSALKTPAPFPPPPAVCVAGTVYRKRVSPSVLAGPNHKSSLPNPTTSHLVFPSAYETDARENVGAEIQLVPLLPPT